MSHDKCVGGICRLTVQIKNKKNKQKTPQQILIIDNYDKNIILQPEAKLIFGLTPDTIEEETEAQSQIIHFLNTALYLLATDEMYALYNDLNILPKNVVSVVFTLLCASNPTIQCVTFYRILRHYMCQS